MCYYQIEIKCGDGVMKNVILILLVGFCVAASELCAMQRRSSYHGMTLAEQAEAKAKKDTMFIVYIMRALRNEDFALAKKLIQGLNPEQSDVNYGDPDHNDCTMLHYVAMEDWGRNAITLAQMLLDKGAYIDVLNDNSDTPLLFAVHFKHLALALFLVQRGAAVWMANMQGMTPLNLLCSSQENVRKMNVAIHKCKKTFNVKQCEDEVLNCFTVLTEKPFPTLKELCMQYFQMVPFRELRDILPKMPDTVRIPFMIARLRAPTRSHKHDFELLQYVPRHERREIATEMRQENTLLLHSINRANIAGDAPLHSAARRGASQEILARLIALGARRNQKNDQKLLPSQLFEHVSCDCERCVVNKDVDETKRMLEYPILIAETIERQITVEEAMEKLDTENDYV